MNRNGTALNGSELQGTEKDQTRIAKLRNATEGKRYEKELN